jgi:CubicO group peptidase (beta-lactamase class C family)
LAKLASIMSQKGSTEVHSPDSIPSRKRTVSLISADILSAALQSAIDLGPDENLGPSMPPLTRCGFGFAQGYKIPNSFRNTDGSFAPKEGSDMEWFGWDGMGGSICVFERTKEIGVGYTVNGLHPGDGWV